MKLLVDLGNCDKDSLGGKDLFETDASRELLYAIAKEIKTSIYAGMPAVELFINEINKRGHEINLITSLDDVEVVLVSANNY